MKRGGAGKDGPAHALQVVLWGCLGTAVAALAVFPATGHPRAGVAAAVGLLIGSVNGHLALRSLTSGASFRIASLGRLSVLSVAGVGIGLLLGTDVVYLTIGGLAVAQLVLAGAAAYEVAR